jgi:Domain of unknown function (DUF4145)
MLKVPFVAPAFRKEGFNCSLCGAFANQDWQQPYFNRSQGWATIDNLAVAYCAHCRQYSVWHVQRMIYPQKLTAPEGHPDMPPEILSDYEEARVIAAASPRSAAALLRLCIQKLCKELGESGKNINDDIAALVAKGLPVTVQRALDIVRVVGNEQVHPGTLDVRDDPEIASELFGLLNFIVEDQIAQPKAIQALYGRLPEEKRKAIEQRDAQKGTQG